MPPICTTVTLTTLKTPSTWGNDTSWLEFFFLQEMGSQSGQPQLCSDWLFAWQWCNPQGRAVLIDEALYLRLLLILCVGLCCPWSPLCTPSCVGRQRFYCWRQWLLLYRLFIDKWPQMHHNLIYSRFLLTRSLNLEMSSNIMRAPNQLLLPFLCILHIAFRMRTFLENFQLSDQ